MDGASVGKRKSNIVKSCAHCHTTEALRWRTGLEGHEVTINFVFVLFYMVFLIYFGSLFSVYMRFLWNPT